ncbi:uncharacterized protein LOC132721778 [Ruditapes philippinarum]|uniref:uncharacterized protein LOC132721778 n=1 Tax=Ruditapes philippinarum TaxID=129788 RepID=UPI00295BD478|nr:uncharacterized protein LOC132721778 [Ruditapes philippinarum]
MEKVSPCKLELPEEIASWTVETTVTSPSTGTTTFEEMDSTPDTVTQTVETVESVPDMVTEIVAETVTNLEPVSEATVVTQSTPLTNETQSTPLTHIKTPSEASAIAFESSVIDSRVSPYGESTSTTFMEPSLSPGIHYSTPNLLHGESVSINHKRLGPNKYSDLNFYGEAKI